MPLDITSLNKGDIVVLTNGDAYWVDAMFKGCIKCIPFNTSQWYFYLSYETVWRVKSVYKMFYTK